LSNAPAIAAVGSPRLAGPTDADRGSCNHRPKARRSSGGYPWATIRRRWLFSIVLARDCRCHSTTRSAPRCRYSQKLIQRREPRNMIRTMFLGRLDCDRLRKAGGIPSPVDQAVAAVAEALHADGNGNAVLANAFCPCRLLADPQPMPPAFDGVIAQAAFLVRGPSRSPRASLALRERLCERVCRRR